MSLFVVGCGVLALGLGTAISGDEKTKPNTQMQKVLDQLGDFGPKPLDTLTPEDARKQPSPADAVGALLKRSGKRTEPEAVAKVKDIEVMGEVGKLPARVYTPYGDGPFPVLVYWHGGGWVIATLDTYDASCRALCNAAKCIVVSCHYRQAPEHPFPAAPNDAFAAYQWVLKNAADFGGDPKRIAVGGESAGGNLAAGVCLLAREEKVTAPVYQLLIYPVLNNNLETDSHKEYADAKPLNKKMMLWFLAHYLGDQPDVARNPLAFPLKAKDHSNLPPATIITAEIDPLRDDGKMYAKKLEDAGVKVTYKNYEGVAHEFFGMGAVVDEAKKAVDKSAEGLKNAFKK